MRFTERQSQILELAAQGHGDKEIASRLGLSVHTVRTHLQRLYLNEGLSNRAEAVAAWAAEQAARAAEAAAGAGPSTEPDLRPFHRRPLHVMPAVAAILALATAGAGAYGVHALLAAGRQAAACGSACSGPAAPATQPAPAASAPVPAAPAGASRPPTSVPGATAATPSGAAPAAPAAPAAALPARLPTPGVQLQQAQGMLAIVNQDRAAAGLPALSWNSCLASVASSQAQRMATQGYVSAGDGPAQDAGCLVSLTPPAEDLGYWSGVNDAQLNTILMADPVERANLLGPFRYLGAAWGVSPNGVAYLAIELR